MFSCCSFPTESLRLAVVVVMLLVEVIYLTKKNRRAALIMAAGSSLDLFASLGVPAIEVAGMYAMGQASSGKEGWVVALLVLMPMLGRLTIGLHLAALLTGTVLLARDLPDEEREAW